MRILILNTDYPRFLERLYAQSTGLAACSYDRQMAARNASLFGVSDFYSRNLRQAGCEAWEIHANNEAMQLRWCREQGIAVTHPSPTLRTIKKQAARLPVVGRRFRSKTAAQPWFKQALAAQVAHYDPDVILNQDIYQITGRFLSALGGRRRMVVGQVASPLPAHVDWQGYDLMVSSLPNLIDHFRGLGMAAQLCPLGFDDAVLDHVKMPAKRDIPVLFIGSFSGQHQGRIRLMEHLCRQMEIEIWGSGTTALERGSPILSRIRGEAWGEQMYQLLGRARIAINTHIDMAGPYANNCRLFEATGMGALLLTDRKTNLGDYFIPGKEVADFDTPEECLERIRFYLSHPEQASDIAEAGHRRTLASHLYRDRMKDLAHLFEQQLASMTARQP